MVQRDPEFYRKYAGLCQCSAERPLMMTVTDDCVHLKKGMDNTTILIMSHAEFLEWSSHKILNKAGVKINDNAGKY
jgi:hypothetical protein